MKVISPDQLKMGTWIEFHDEFGGVYQGRVLEVRSRDCRVLIENVVKEPSTTHCLNEATSVSAEYVTEQYGLTDFPSQDMKIMLPDYHRGSTNDHYPWIVRIIETGKSTRKSEGVSDLGAFLSDPLRYNVGPEGETGGPSGLSFL